MFSKGQRRKDDRKATQSGRGSANDALTFLSPGSRLEGTLTTSAPLRVDGFVKGQIRAEADVTIGESGRVEGPVRAARVLVAGILEGEVEAEVELRILPTGQLIGDVRTPNLIVEEGALFKGMSEMVKGEDLPRVTVDAKPSPPASKPQTDAKAAAEA